MNDNVKSWPGC